MYESSIGQIKDIIKEFQRLPYMKVATIINVTDELKSCSGDTLFDQKRIEVNCKNPDYALYYVTTLENEDTQVCEWSIAIEYEHLIFHNGDAPNHEDDPKGDGLEHGRFAIILVGLALVGLAFAGFCMFYV